MPWKLKRIWLLSLVYRIQYAGRLGLWLRRERKLPAVELFIRRRVLRWHHKLQTEMEALDV